MLDNYVDPKVYDERERERERDLDRRGRREARDVIETGAQTKKKFC